MKERRKVIAAISGVAIALGYIFAKEAPEIWGPRIYIGIIFGAGVAVSMIRNPEKISRNYLMFLLAPLLAGFIAWIAICESTRLLQIFIWAIFFFSSQVAFFLSPSWCPKDKTSHHPQ
jgi:hypothetical protein